MANNPPVRDPVRLAALWDFAENMKAAKQKLSAASITLKTKMDEAAQARADEAKAQAELNDLRHKLKTFVEGE